MSSLIVSRKYAQSLFEVTEKTASAVLSELKQLGQILSKEALSFFSSPHNSAETKKSVMNSALEGKCSNEVYNFVMTLVKNNRLEAFQKIMTEFEQMVMAAGGSTKGVLWAATDVSQEFIKKVEDQAAKAIGKKVELKFEKKPDLIAGFKVQVGGWTMDDSASAHLKILKDELMKRGL